MSKATKGSQFHLQNIVNRFPGVLDVALGLGKIEWVSPLASDGYKEYQDASFLTRLGISLSSVPLSSFWPNNGPVWDGLGKAPSGELVLVEAKSHIPEIFSQCEATASVSIEQIETSLDDTKTALKAKPDRDWTKPFYQYANRLAHAYFLNDLNKVPARLVFLHFVGDTAMGGPTTKAEWEAAIVILHEALGITGHVPKYVQDVFVDVSEADKGIYRPIQYTYERE